MLKRQGTVLIAVLGIITIVAVLLMQLNFKFYNAVRLTAAWQHNIQVKLYAQGELAWAASALAASGATAATGALRQWQHQQAGYVIISKLRPVTLDMLAKHIYPLRVRSMLHYSLAVAKVSKAVALLSTQISSKGYGTTYYSLLHYSTSNAGTLITLLWQINSEQ